MPELPDVEIYKRYIDATALHKKISGVHLHTVKILRGVSAQKLKSNLKGRKMESTERHGKHLFIHLDSGELLMLHFGMTGNVQYFRDDDVEYDQLRLDFENGYHMAYISRRKLGKIGLVRNIDGFIKEKKLGPDALSLNKQEFSECLAKGRGPIKSTLMNQKIMSGIGNIYSDEILFQSGLHPAAETQKLDDREKHNLCKNMRKVLDTAIRKRAQPDEFPRSYMIPRRRKGGECPVCSGKLKSIKMSGRTAWYCPSCQKKK